MNCYDTWLGDRLCFLRGTVQPPIWQVGHYQLKLIVSKVIRVCSKPHFQSLAQVIWEAERARWPVISFWTFHCFASTLQPKCISQSWICHANCFWQLTVDDFYFYPLDRYRASWSANMIMENPSACGWSQYKQTIWQKHVFSVAVFRIQMATTSIFQISILSMVSKSEISNHISDHFLFRRKPWPLNQRSWQIINICWN